MSFSVETREQEVKPKPSNAVLFIRNFNDNYMGGSWCGEVTGPFTVRQVINLHKLLVVPIYLGMIWYFAEGDFSLTQTWGHAAGVLLVCHGSYGFLWVYKAEIGHEKVHVLHCFGHFGCIDDHRLLDS